jgi:metal-responsive CopG/Arc/MetJ family transcriptional regulator
MPQVTVSIPLSLLVRVDAKVAETGAKSRSAWIVKVISDELTDENDGEEAA